MKVVVVDPKNILSYKDVAYDLVRLDGMNSLDLSRDQDVDILVICSPNEDLNLINSAIKENVWKIYVHKDFEGQYPVEKWREFCFVEVVDNDFDFTKLKSLEDSTALINNKINFKDKFDFNSIENQKLQSAIDDVFKEDEEEDMSSDDSGLKIKMPEAKNNSQAQDLDISLDLSDEEVSQEMSVPADTGLDMGDLDASALSLSSSDESSPVIEAPISQDRPGDLDFDDTSVPEFGFHAKGDIIEAPPEQKEELESAAAASDELDASISDLDGIDEFSDLDLSEEAGDDLDLSADGLDDDLGDIEDLDEGELDDLDLGHSSGDSTGKTQVTSQNDIDEINQKMGSAALSDNQLIEQKSEQLGEEISGEERIGTDTFNKSINTLLGIKAPLPSLSKDVSDEDLEDEQGSPKQIKQLPKQPAILKTMARADETGEIDVSSLLGQANKEETAPVKQYSAQAPSSSESTLRSQVTNENFASVNSNYSASDLLDIKITLSELKDDRKNLLDEITNLEQEKDQLLRQNLNLKADLDELKIELSIMKKRHIAELEDYKQQNAVLQEKREILEAKNKNYQREIERLGSKIRIDFSKIKQREKELEGQLELVTIDAESKVKSRDLKILELKRKIDALEFNMENISIKEKQSLQDKNSLEEKLNKVVGTLRNSLSLLEQDIDIEEITKSFKKENDF